METIRDALLAQCVVVWGLAGWPPEAPTVPPCDWRAAATCVTALVDQFIRGRGEARLRSD